MFSVLMLVLAVVDLAIVVWIARAWWPTRDAALGLVLFLAAALPYDAALVGLGRWIGAGDLLATLSLPRFMLFNLSVPLTLVLAAALARAGGLLKPPWAMGLVWLVAAGFLLLDWRGVVAPGPLYPACWADTLRYVPGVSAEQVCLPGQGGVGLAGQFPRAGILALPAIVLVGALLWWRARWPWLFLGLLAGFLLLGLPPRLVGPIPGFVGDTLNIVAFAVTAMRFARPVPAT